MSNTNSVIYAPMLSALQEQSIDSFYEGIEQILNFDEALRPKERRDIIKLVRQNLIFVREAMEAIDEVPTLAPQYMDVAQTQNRFELHEQIRLLEDKTRAFAEKLRDMRYRIGRQCWEDGLTIYNSAKIATNNRVPRASYYYNRMRKRFVFAESENGSGSGSGSGASDDTPTNDETTPVNNQVMEDVQEAGTNSTSTSN